LHLSKAVVAAVVLLAGCAQAPAEKPQVHEPAPPATLGALPATYVDEAGCPGCLAATMTLRADGSFLLREQLGATEFYDFGKWRYADGKLELAGDRDTRTYPVTALRRAQKVETLRGPFRMVGLYDGARFKECRTGVSWTFAETRAAETLQQEFRKQPGAPALVSLDAQFEGSPETLRMFRPALLHNSHACPG
jgi:hypothetical protein